MAKGINKVILIGRLGSDPELRYTSKGTAVANLSIATSRAVKRDDEWEEETDWHKVVAWKQKAEFISTYASKGSLVYVEGHLQTRSWEDQDGNKKYITEVQARDVQLLGSSEAKRDPKNTEPTTMNDDVPF